MSASVDVKALFKEFSQRNKNVPELKFLCDQPDDFSVEEVIGGGLTNRIFIVNSRSNENQSAVLKYGEGKWIFGSREDKTISLKRQDTEYYSLSLLDEILPGCAPKPYCHDKELHIIAMEDLSHMVFYGPIFREKGLTSDLAVKIGDMLGKIHHRTHRKAVSSEKWQEMTDKLKHTEDFNKLLELRFRRTYDEKDEVITVPENILPYYRRVSKLILERNIPEKLIQLSTSPECFIHGDPHHYSFFVSDDRISIFDPEFAVVGNPITDLSFMLVVFYVCHLEASEKNKKEAEKIKEECKDSLKLFVQAYIAGYEGELSILGDWEDFVRGTAALMGGICMTGAVLDLLEPIITMTDCHKELLFKKGAFMMNVSNDITTMEEIFTLMFAESHKEI